MAVISELFVNVNSNVRGLTTGLATAKGSLTAFGRTAQATARGTTAAFGGIGPVIAGAFAVGAAASIKSAVAYEDAFTRISAISNSSEQDIARWKDQVLDLAGTTAKAPQELADALFFLSSAGLESGQVMEALEVSAKAAASGLGSTVDVANIVASALNAYAEAGLEAADVTDTLVAAVREGRAEPEQFAGALGRILPIASKAGVTFQDVTASLASLSNIGLDVEEAVTAMRGVLQAITAPGSQAAEAMDALGLSAQDLLDAISEQGLMGALRLLDEQAKATTSTQAQYIGVLRKIVPNVRALTGVLGLTGQEAEKVDRIFQNVTGSTGSLDRAFQKTTEGPGFVFRKLMNDLRITAIDFGRALLPVVVDALRAVAPLLEFVSKNARLLLMILLGYAAVKFLPLLLKGISEGLFLVARASAALGAVRLGEAALGAATGVAGLGSAAAGANLAIGALVLGGFALYKVLTMNRDAARKVAAEIKAAGGRFLEMVQTTDQLWKITKTYNDEVAKIEEGAISYQFVGKAVQSFKDEQVAATRATELFRQANQGVAHLLRTGAIDIDRAALGFRALGLSVDETTDRIRGIIESMKLQGQLTRTQYISMLVKTGLSYQEAQVRADAFLASLEAIRDGLSGGVVAFGLGRTLQLEQVNRMIGIFTGKADELAITGEKIRIFAASVGRGISDAFRKVREDVPMFLEVTGQSFSEFRGNVRDALNDVETAIKEAKDPVGVWRDFVTEQVGLAADAVAEWRSRTVESLDFGAQAFRDVASDFEGSSAKIADALTDALMDQRQFARDLKTILDDGTVGAKLLVQELIDMGPAGVSAAHAIATGSTEVRTSIETSLRKTRGFAETTAETLSRRILGTLRDIRDFFDNLTIALEKTLEIDINGDSIIGAKEKAKDLEGQLALIHRREWEATVTADTTAADTALGRFFVRWDGRTINVRLGVTTPSEIRWKPIIIEHAGGRVPPSPEVLRHAGGIASDELLAVLERGEFVIRRRAAEAIGLPVLQALNRLHEGGQVSGPELRVSTPRSERPREDQKIQVVVDRRRFGRDLDADYVVRGW